MAKRISGHLEQEVHRLGALGLAKRDRAEGGVLAEGGFERLGSRANACEGVGTWARTAVEPSSVVE